MFHAPARVLRVFILGGLLLLHGLPLYGCGGGERPPEGRAARSDTPAAGPPAEGTAPGPLEPDASTSGPEAPGGRDETASAGRPAPGGVGAEEVEAAAPPESVPEAPRSEPGQSPTRQEAREPSAHPGPDAPPAPPYGAGIPSIQGPATGPSAGNAVQAVTRAFEEARRADTPEGYERFLEAWPDSPHERAAAERLETLLFEAARESGTPDAYKRFLYRFPLTGRTEEVLAAVDPICSLRSLDTATVTSCRELLGLLPYSDRKAELLAWVHGLEESLKSDRVGYERHLLEPAGLASVFQRFPLQGAGSGVTKVSDLPVEAIWRQAEAHHRKHGIEHPAANPSLERLYFLFVTWDLVSRLRFHRGAAAFHGHQEVPEIGAHIVEGRWFEEFLAKVTARPEYGFSEVYPVRLILAIHTAAHFFELPFPTLFCLIFQESKFDFTVTSAVGAVGLGQLTPVGVQQVEKLRGKQEYEARLQAATAHLGNVYRDEGVRRILERMGIRGALPDLPPRFPKTVGQTFPQAVNAEFLQDVSRLLQVKGLPYASDLTLVRAKCRLLSRGIMLPDRFAPLQGAYHEAMERRFGKKLGNVYNPETNILYSALLLRYYMKYRWCVGGQDLELRPLVRSMAAVVSYNQGQTGVRRYLERIQREFPGLDMNEVTLAQTRKLFTKERLATHHPGKPGTVEEVYRHATAIGTCSCRPPETNG